MTAQAFEKIIFNGEEYDLATEPLEDYLNDSAISFDFLNTSLSRGYIGTWEVKENKLYLKDLEGTTNNEKIGMEFLFNKSGSCFAYWYSGSLKIVFGDMLSYSHRGFFSIFENEYILEVDKGFLVKKTIIKNIDKEKKIILREIDYNSIIDESLKVLRDSIMNSNSYPFIKLPQKIHSLECGVLEDLEPLKAPEKPILKSKNEGYLWSVGILFLLFLSIKLNWIESFISVLFFIVGLILSISLIYENYGAKRKSKEEYNIKTEKYKREFLEVERENGKRNKLRNNLKTELKIKAYRDSFLKEFFSNKTYEGLVFNFVSEFKREAIRGRFDLGFYLILQKIFKNNICNDLCIELDGYSAYEYTPDVIFSNDRIFLDIEIDEPYTLEGKPIHSFNDLRELNRNSFFTDKNFIVIRFSENQIALYPIQCCFFIASCIYYFTNDIQYMLDIINNYNFNLILEKEERWDEELSLKYVKQNYRKKTFDMNESIENSIKNLNRIVL
ncbi:hypothetical protein NBRC110019_18250 [Neptunitalea chrysea]|uniref:Uncharacterized protein n=1 Tax=Neptunitalea chrysea TaxID=1647581 RepID=A0A9W6B743_9FLAO|nr:hypothetical protein [Neptunitalea chrysea]GLB52785.1 hypothetical protein NBRC110019_18250 [Neptunitalea chrysea]